jgi:hypothetical protein
VIQVHWSIPAAQQTNPALHAAKPNTTTHRRWWSKLSDGLTVTGNYNVLTILNSADQFRETVLRFGDTDIHAADYSQKL